MHFFNGHVYRVENFKYKGKRLLHYPFPMYHHLWTQHHLFIMLGILRSWVFNFFFFLTEKTEKTEKTQRQLFIMRHPCFPDYPWKFMFIDLQSFLTGKMENSFPRDEHVKSMIIVQGQLNVLGLKTTTLGEAFSFIKMLIEK